MITLIYVLLFKQSVITADDYSILPWFFVGIIEFAVIEFPIAYFLFIERAPESKSAGQKDLKLQERNVVSSNKRLKIK